MRALTWIAAAAWLASWFLPVIDGYPGWAAFRAALEGPFRESFPIQAEDSVPQIASALTNVAFVGMFALLIRNRVVRAGLFLRVAIICLIVNFYWLVQMLRAGETAGLLFGYYLWLAAFALLVAAAGVNVFSSRRTSKTPTAGTPA